MKFGPSCFHSQMLKGFIFPVWASWCYSLFLSLLCICRFLPPVDTVVPFSIPLRLRSSYPLWCVFFSTFSCGVCSVSLHVVFWAIYTYMSVIWLYLWDQLNLGSSYSTIFPACFLMGMTRLVKLQVIVNMVKLKSTILLLIFYLPSVLISVCSSLPSLN